MAEQQCPMFEICGLFASLTNEQKEQIAQTWCQSDFEGCARKQLKDRGGPVPDDLWPGGHTKTNSNEFV